MFNTIKLPEKRMTRAAKAAAMLALFIALASERVKTGHAQPLDSQYNKQQEEEQNRRRLAAQMHQSAQFEGFNPGFGCDGSSWLARYYIDSNNQIWEVSEGPYVNTYRYSYQGRLNNETRTGGKVKLFKIEEASDSAQNNIDGGGRQMLISYTRESSGMVTRWPEGCRR